MSDRISDKILSNRYKLESEIGRGGMGVVYRAEDMQVKRIVAIKTLPAVMTHNQELMKRFNSEVKNASKLEHPNIARVFDVGEDDGTHYYVMQYIDGSDLRAEIKKRGRFSVDETIRIISQVADALDYAHSQGIVHRDIKPENILLDKEGNAHVVDFGIAKATEGTRTTRGMLGTPEYMSPEQVKGKSVDGRSDQYSLATMAYEMLTGHTPFKTEGDDPWAQINMHLNTPVPNPRTTVPDLPNHIANTLLQALAKKPEQRFGSCGELVQALRGEINAVVSPGERFVSTVWPRKAVVAGTAATVLAVFIIVGLLLVRESKPNRSLQTKLHPAVRTAIIYIDKSNPRMDAVCSMDEDGVETRRLGWFPQVNLEFKYNKVLVSMNGEIVAYPESGGFSILNTVSSSVQKFDAQKFKEWGFDFAELLCISGDGKYILFLDRKGVNDAILSYSISEHKAKTVSTSVSVDGYMGGNAPELNAPSDELAMYPAFSPDGKYLAYADKNGKIFIASSDGSAQREVSSFSVKRFDVFGSALFNEDSSKLFVLTSHDYNRRCELRCIDVKNNSKTRALTVPGGDIVEAVGQTAFIQHDTRDAGVNIQELYLVDMGNGSRTSLGKAKAKLFSSVDDQRRIAILETYEHSMRNGEILRMDLRSGKVTPARSMAFVVGKALMKSDVGQLVSQTRHNPNLPSTHLLVGECSADFGGDGSAKQVFFALKQDGSSPKLWVEKDSHMIWEMPSGDMDYRFGRYPKITFNRSKVQVLAKDLTGDGVPELCFVLPMNEYIAYLFHAYKWNGNSFTCITDRISKYDRDSNGISLGIENPLIRDGGSGKSAEFAVSGNYYQWNGKEFEAYKKDSTLGDYKQRLRRLKSDGFRFMIDMGIQ